MVWSKPSVKRVKTNLESAQIYIRSVRKWGKTTLFRNLVLQKFGDAERGLLVGLGAEEGYGFLDQLNSTQITNYKDFFEMIKWLISEKGKQHNIEMVGFDVVDELIPMMEYYVVKLSLQETGKVCKTINEAFGGFHKGQKRCALEIKKIMTKLKDSGIGVIAISHTKNKTIKPQGVETEEDGYMTLTSTLESTYESVFSDIFDIIVTGVVERDVENGKLKSANRYLQFRDDGYIEAGGRLAKDSIVDRMLFEGKDDYELAGDFINIVEDAMRRSTLAPSVDKDKFKKLQEEEKAEIKEKSEEFIKEEVKEIEKADSINIERNKEIQTIIVSKWKETPKEVKEEIKAIMKKYEISKIGEVEKNTTKGMEEILSKIN